VRELYGVSNIFGLFPARITYVIAEEGVVRHVFSSQPRISEHVEEALGAFRAIKA
jgi:thioredoxin-dependent peroxiredoxin